MSKHILVVDDSKEAADAKIFVIDNLAESEFTAEAAYGGQECLDRLAKPPKVDLILLDMDMPGVNGADVIRALLEMQEPPAHVLPMTAWGPDWIQHWGMTEIAKTPAYQKWIWPASYDKAGEPMELIHLIRQIFERPGA